MDVYPIQHNHLIAPLISEKKNVVFNSQINKKIDEEIWNHLFTIYGFIVFQIFLIN
jgi:hypothetical protein